MMSGTGEVVEENEGGERHHHVEWGGAVTRFLAWLAFLR